VRQASSSLYFTVILVVLITILGSFAQNGNGSVFSGSGFGDKGSTSDKIKGLLDSTEPISDNPDVAFRANLVPAPNNGFLNVRHNPPVWERIFAVKPMKVLFGLFFAIMLISLFFIFYRNARNSSGSDEDARIRINLININRFLLKIKL
jgi:hypothetical protein